MKKLIHLPLIVLALLLTLASNCKKPEKQKYLGTYPLGEIKEYLYFKPGSMWVYECDSTLELDTQYMIKCDTFWEEHSYIKFGQLSSIIQSKNEGSKYIQYVDGFRAYNKNYKYFFPFMRDRSNPKDQGTGQDCIFFKPFDSSVYGGGSSPTKYKGYIDSMEILGKKYYSIQTFKVQATSGWPRLNTWRIDNLNHATSMEYYWAREVGLIKLKVFTYDRIRNEPFTHNWNLKEYKILKV